MSGDTFFDVPDWDHGLNDVVLMWNTKTGRKVPNLDDWNANLVNKDEQTCYVNECKYM